MAYMIMFSMSVEALGADLSEQSVQIGRSEGPAGSLSVSRNESRDESYCTAISSLSNGIVGNLKIFKKIK